MRKEVEFEWPVYVDSLDGKVNVRIKGEAVQAHDGGGYLYYIDRKGMNVDIERGFEQFRPEVEASLHEDESLCAKAKMFFND